MSTEEMKEMELLSAYIDGELEEAEKNRVGSFLSNSPEGRRALERLKHTKTLLMATPPVTVPSDFLDKLEEQAERAMKREAGRAFWRFSNPWAWTSPMAAAAAMVALAFGLKPARQIPFSTLVAAHEALQTDSGLHQKVVAAAHYEPSTEKANAGI
jgi:anti-sigma factor RsiW